MNEKILIADDEESIRYTFSEILTGSGYQVKTAESLSDCIKQLQTESFDLLLLDVGFGPDNGIEAIEGIKVLQPSCVVVIITGGFNPTAMNKARQSGAVDYIVKPVYEASLKYITQKSLHH